MTPVSTKIHMPKLQLSAASAMFSLITLIAVGTALFRRLEEWSWAESFYFTVTTLTTVGYGDIHPTSDVSRVTAAIFILLSVGIVIAALSKIGSGYLSAQEHRLSDNIARRIHRRKEVEEHSE
jgi:voltage-gated potassium channel Kch